MELKITAATTRAVSARTVTRQLAGLFDEMEEEGTALVVVRYGRPAAMLVPLEPKVRRAPRRVRLEDITSAPVPKKTTRSARRSTSSTRTLASS